MCYFLLFSSILGVAGYTGSIFYNFFLKQKGSQFIRKRDTEIYNMDLPELKAVDSLTTEEVLSALKTLRTVPLRRSALTCALAQRALRASGLGNEKWVIVEQVCSLFFLKLQDAGTNTPGV